MFQRCVFLLSFFFLFVVAGGSHGEGKYVPVTGDASEDHNRMQIHGLGKTIGLKHSESGSKGSPDTKACKSDKDCALVNPGCCPCSNGGESIAIHKALIKPHNIKARGKCNSSVQSFCHTVNLCGKFKAKCKSSKCVKVKCPAGQRKICETRTKEHDHNVLTIDIITPTPPSG